MSKLRLSFYSPANTEILGYGRAYLGIKKYLQRLADPDIELVFEQAPADVSIFFGTPWPQFKKYSTRQSNRHIIFTMWETSVLPEKFLNGMWAKEGLAQYDEIIVPCQWNKQIFIENGIGVPINVIPLGLDPDTWPFIERKRNGNEPFTFLWQGTFPGDRKGGELVWESFYDLDLPNSKLILKGQPSYLNSKTIFDVSDGRVDLLIKVLTEAEMIAMFAQSDVSIYPSYGEGFGLIPLEHLATGLPLIMSDNTGLSEYANAQYMTLLFCDKKTASYSPEYGYDYIPDKDVVKEEMARAYANRAHIHEGARERSDWVRNTWSIEQTAKRIIELCKAG